MTSARLTLRHIAFVGPIKEPAILEFGPGLNVIYGASDTGKSFLREAIDFMLGSKKALRDIPERVGYDLIFLGIELASGEAVTLARATSGGAFLCYQGLHTSKPADQDSIQLSPKHNPTNGKNISMFLLEKIGLAGKRIRKNARNETNSLSFRNLAHLCLVSEGDIQKEGSPVETGQIISRTAELSVFKLLITGVDDGAVEPDEAVRTRRLSQTAKIEVIDDLIASGKERLVALIGDDDDENELSDQLDRLNQTLEQERESLDQSEGDYRAVVNRRNKTRHDLEGVRERRQEISELLERFELLDRHYQSDLVRLEGVRESGVLFSALESLPCPLCGAEPEHHHHDDSCDGDLDSVIEAAIAEAAKIITLRSELAETVGRLSLEEDECAALMPQLEERWKRESEELQAMNPEIKSQRAAYSELLGHRTTIQNALSLITSISELEERRAELEEVPSPATSQPENAPATDLSHSVLNSFSKVYEEVLQSWNFPQSERVHFDAVSRDFVIAGKLRSARGKGLRALSHAAFTLALMIYTKRYALPHPGFVVIDTPLLAYREPDGDEDDLSGTNVHQNFYNDLHALTDRQMIILENIDPPDEVKASEQCHPFSGNPHDGRYGFFPL